MGSSCAARRAGQTPKTRPMPPLTPNASSTASTETTVLNPASWAMAHATPPTETYAEKSAQGADGQGLGEELGEDVETCGAERLAHADLPDTLRHRDQHDVHDADAAHDKADTGHPAEQEGEDRHGLLLRLDELLGIHDHEVVRRTGADLVLATHHPFYVDHPGLERYSLGDLGGQPVEPVAAEYAQFGGRQRDEHVVVGILPGKADLFEHADDLESDPVDGDHPADDVLGFDVEVHRNLLAEHRDATSSGQIALAEHATVGHIDAVYAGVVGRRAVDPVPEVLVAVLDLPVRRHFGDDFGEIVRVPS